ncbi:hypothetical protein H2200_007975 [Cladophialophora chaetospira]|uniref:M6 family metalloprotease domain-containing protein n=1 Tax=Cladophialophora chaetospira TaxID=386627 RepID=A0AA38X6V9_9EURO|nr:hypothetical protein H2200_007975 [Cladophialophora chaetospira]
MVRRQLLSSVTIGLLGLGAKVAFTLPWLGQQQHISADETARLPAPSYALNEMPLIKDSAIGFSEVQESCKLPFTSRQLNEGFGSDPTTFMVPSTGILQAYMVFVEFDDAPASEKVTDLFDLYMPAASEWYGNASFGRLNLRVTADLSRFHRMPRNASAYDYRRGMGYKFHRKYVQDALDAVGESVDFAGTDLLYIVPTREAAAISYSPTFMPPIEAHDGTLIKKTVTFGQDVDEFGFQVMNHETGHTMGLCDLYSYTPHTQAGVYVGGYDLMAQIGGISPDFLAWHKWRLGWLDDDQIMCLTPGAKKSVRGKGWRVVLTPIEEGKGLKALVVKRNATLALVAENRSGRRLNSATCGTGVLIYTVSTITESGRGPIRVQDSSPDSGCAGQRLNDALFVPGHHNRSSFTSPEFGVNIEVLEEIKEGFVLNVSLL